MNKVLKNIEGKKVIKLVDEVDFAPGQIVSKTLVQNEKIGITLFAFADGEFISTHSSSGDALVTALDGIGEITIDGDVYTVKDGESIIMPADMPHAVKGIENFKMSLTVTF